MKKPLDKFCLFLIVFAAVWFTARTAIGQTTRVDVTLATDADTTLASILANVRTDTVVVRDTVWVPADTVIVVDTVWVTRTITIRPIITTDTTVVVDTTSTTQPPLPKPGETVDLDSLLTDAYVSTRQGINRLIDLEGKQFESVSIANPGPGVLAIQNGTLNGWAVPRNATHDGTDWLLPWVEDCPADDPTGGRIGPLGLMCEIVRIDNVLSYPVTCANLSAGTYCRADSNTVRVRAPSTSTLAVSTSSAGVEVGGVNTILRDITIEGIATVPRDLGACLYVYQSRHLRLENVDVRECNWSGLMIQHSEDVTIVGGSFNDHGYDGFVSHLWHTGDADGFEQARNAWRAVAGNLAGWSVGNKHLRTFGVTFRNCNIHDNFRRGLWIDYAGENVRIDNCDISDNGGPVIVDGEVQFVGEGIWLEGNPGPIAVINSRFVGNDQAGIKITSTHNVTLRGNEVRANTGRGLGTMQINECFGNAPVPCPGRTIGLVDWDAFLVDLTFDRTPCGDRMCGERDLVHGFNLDGWTVDGNNFQDSRYLMHFDENIGSTEAQRRWNDHAASSTWTNNNYCHPDPGVFSIGGFSWFEPFAWWVGMNGETGATWCGP